jgi:Protein of unknown function (DUF1501)
MIDRRDFLRFTFASGLAAGLGSCARSIAPAPRAAAPGPAGTPAPSAAVGPGRARACILLYMVGGPSQLDTFDPKPGTDSAAGLGAIATTVDGVRFGELLPGVARQARRLAVIRSISSSEGNHVRAVHLMHTGYTPGGGVQHPAFGALVSAERSRGPLPGYVAIGGPGADGGFLGAAHSPFAVLAPSRPVRNLHRFRGLDQERFAERLELRRQLDRDFAAAHASPIVAGQRAVNERAVAMMNASQVAAFELEREHASTRRTYGESDFGLGCLMARRLVEAGVPFVEVMHKGWDTHFDHQNRIRPLCAELDRAMSALLADLAARGLLDSTLVVWTGDFGRTPEISARGGRDHYPKVTPAVLAGGGVRGGQVIGATDGRGVEVVERSLSVPDLFASICAALGLDPRRSRMSPEGRPLTTVDGGSQIKELFA